MNYELKHFDTTLVRFTATEDTNTPEIKILWKNDAKKDLFPLDLDLTEEGIAKWLKHRTIPKNRAYVHNLLGNRKASKKDYDTAQKKVAEYREKNASGDASFADTTSKYTSLLALDAEFARKDFDNELLQHRDIDIKLRPLYRFVLTGEKDDTNYALSQGYENPLIMKFRQELPVGVAVRNADKALDEAQMDHVRQQAWSSMAPASEEYFIRALAAETMAR